jgi:hypothetical protein
MRKSNEASLGEVIKSFLKLYRMEDKITEVKINSVWEKIMGHEINRLTERIVLKDKKLQVYLRSAPLREELTMARTKIATMINKELNAKVVEEVIFR